MLTFIAKLLLSCSHSTVIVPLIIFGYIWIDRKIFFHALCLILLSMLFNFALKITFQIPLLPHLGKQGFAFPSGHMHSCIALYGWLITKIPKFIIKIILINLLIGIGLSLIYFGYHNYFDILGAILFGSILIFTYTYFLNKFKNNSKIFKLLLLLFSTILMLYIAIIYQTAPYLWLTYSGFVGILLLEHYVIKANFFNPSF